ncbi:MAG: lipid-A-disaccharide synthase N-terminal domain-containing protein [Planctomycetota bacterium]
MRPRLAAILAALVLAVFPTTSSAQDVDLQRRLGDLHVESTPQGYMLMIEGEGVDERQFFARLYAAQREQERKGLLYKLFNITTPWGFLWVTLGFAGQALFTFRMLLQWLVSEREGRSVVPVGFWWGSLLGGLMLLTYFCWRKDIVGIVGQSTGAFIYVRNLVLIYRTRRCEP